MERFVQMEKGAVKTGIEIKRNDRSFRRERLWVDVGHVIH
jgi:hypothetical protein